MIHKIEQLLLNEDL